MFAGQRPIAKDSVHRLDAGHVRVERRHHLVRDGHVAVLPGRRVRRDGGAYREQLALNRLCDPAHLFVIGDRAGKTERRAEFVDGAVRLDPQVRL